MNRLYIHFKLVLIVCLEFLTNINCAQNGNIKKPVLKICEESINSTNFLIKGNPPNPLNSSDFELSFGYCVEPPYIALTDSNNWKLFPNGSFLESGTLANGSYFEQFVKDACYQYYDSNLIIKCFESNPHLKVNLHKIALIVSLVFLVPTIFLYFWVPKFSSGKNGKTVIHFTFCILFWSMGLLGIKDYWFYNQTIICSGAGYWTQFWILSCFFWLGFMSYDIYSHIGGSFTQQQATISNLKACLMVYGLSLTFVIANLILHNVKSLEYNFAYCFVNGTRLIDFFVLYFPIMLVIGCTSVLCVLTARKFFKEKFQRDKNFNSTQIHNCQISNHFCIFIRLFLLMGVPWCAECVSLLYEYITKDYEPYPIFIITEFWNMLQGVWLFLNFITTMKFRKHAAKRLKFLSWTFKEQESVQLSNTNCTTVDSSHYEMATDIKLKDKTPN